VIATDPSPAPTLLEPWRWGGAGDASLENTLSARRRRARVEFQPASFTAAPDHGERLEGPDLLHMASPEQDLTRSSDEALLLRVWVYLEEADTVGAQRSAWTRERSARAVVLEDDGTGRATVTTAVRWRVIARDGEVERKLLRDIEKELAMADARDGRR